MQVVSGQKVGLMVFVVCGTDAPFSDSNKVFMEGVKGICRATSKIRIQGFMNIH